MIRNSKGTVYYGMHFYPGVAEYKDPSAEPFRVFLNEDTIRAMGPSFAGRPVFVMHVDEVSSDIDTLKGEADGWVVKSFYNEADGKHWVEFIVVSERGEKAIASGFRLSNCYEPKSFDRGGEWNGVSYQKEVTGGEYEHLAIVPNPRYEESVVLTPEQFKEYNETKRLELQRLANDKGEQGMLKLFTRKTVENSKDLENMIVVLPKSGREVAITTLVNEADAAEEKKKAPIVAGDDHMVNVGDKTMSVADLKNAYMDECAKNAEGEETVENEEDEDTVENEEDELANDGEAQLKEEKEKEVEAAKTKNAKIAADKKAAAKKAADKLRNAHERGNYEDAATPTFDPTGGVNRGKARYGS